MKRILIIALLVAVLPVFAAVDVLLCVAGERGYWADLEAELASDARIGTIGYFDASDPTAPPLEVLLEYDVIFVDRYYLSSDFGSSVGTGNRLAQAVDSGCHVILAGGALADTIYDDLAGAIVEPPYSPLVQAGCDYGGHWFTSQHDEDHPIFDGVSPPTNILQIIECRLSTCGHYIAVFEEISSHDEYPGVGINYNENVVAINLLYSDPYYHDWVGDGDLMVANACWWLGEGGAAVVETSWGAIKATSR